MEALCELSTTHYTNDSTPLSVWTVLPAVVEQSISISSANQNQFRIFRNGNRVLFKEPPGRSQKVRKESKNPFDHKGKKSVMQLKGERG